MKKLYFIISIALISISVVIGIKGVEASVVSTATLGDGLVGYWKFDEGTTTSTIIDSSGYGHNLSATTTGSEYTASTTVPSQIKFTDPYSAVFSTSTQKLTGTNDTIFQTKAITVSFWVKPTVTISSGSAQKTVISNYGTNGNERYGYSIAFSSNNTSNNGTLDLAIGGGAGVNGFISHTSTRATWTANTWYHVVVVDNGTTYKMYVNGVLDNTGSSIPFSWTYMQFFLVGSGGTSYVNGALDDLRLYNRAFNPGEVSALYNANSVQFKPTTIKTATLDNGLVGYWRLDEATTTGLMLDSSGYGNNLVASTTAAGLPFATATTSTPTQIKFSDAGSVFFTGNKQILVGSTSPSLLLSQGVTMSMWYRATSTVQNGSVQQTLLTYTGSNGADRYGYGLYLSPGTTPTPNDGRVALLLGAGTGAGAWNTYASVRQTWTANTWYHILVTSDNKTYRIYVNGVLDSSGVSASIQNGFQNGIYMCGVTTLYCSGTIDDVRIYNRSLNPHEVTALYAASSPQYKQTIIGHTQTNFLKNGLLAYWTFDGNSIDYLSTQPLFLDMSGSNSTGTASFTTGRATMLSAGKTGSAIKLNGTSQYITLGASSRYIAATSSPTSVSLWFNANTISSGTSIPHRMFSILKFSTGSTLILGLGKSNTIQFWDGFNIWDLPITVATNRWYHLAFVYDGTKSQVYLNGVANGTSTTYTLYPGSSDLANIGADAPRSSNFFDGSIDGVRVYNRAISTQEINQLYLSGM